jgi:hypothetical protein
LKTGSDEVHEETTLKLTVMGRPLGLAILVIVWIMGGLIVTINGGNYIYHIVTNELYTSFGGPGIYYTIGTTVSVIGVFLILIAIGLWRSMRKVWIFAICTSTVISLAYISILIGNLLMPAGQQLSLYFLIAILSLLSFVYLLINRSWFKQLNP